MPVRDTVQTRFSLPGSRISLGREATAGNVYTLSHLAGPTALNSINYAVGTNSYQKIKINKQISVSQNNEDRSFRNLGLLVLNLGITFSNTNFSFRS